MKSGYGKKLLEEHLGSMSLDEPEATDDEGGFDYERSFSELATALGIDPEQVDKASGVAAFKTLVQRYMHEPPDDEDDILE